MRLHSLRVEAFGPFSAPAEIDFDALHDAGLFLFTGPTGSGKSSLLDAVCFGLYGQVPGTRDVKALRSDHAAAHVTPSVEIQFSVGARRFLIKRSPAFERPKRRGDGTTTQQASVVLEEMRSGDWVTLSTRLDEAGHLVTDLLGMLAGQFTQVAMLPQGEFQQFLVSSSDDRKVILQRLFDTQRFEQVEAWLAQHRQGLVRRAEELRGEVGSVLHRVAEAGGVELPGEAPAALSSAEIVAWLSQVRESLATESESSRERVGASRAAAQAAAAEHESAIARHQARHKLAAARESLAELARTAPEARDAQRRLEEHRRAEPVLVLGRLHTEATTALADARRRVTATLTRLELPSSTSLDDVLNRQARRTRQLHAIQDFLPRHHELATARNERDEIQVELDVTEADRDKVLSQLDSIPRERAAVEESLLRARLDLGRLPVLRASVHEAEAGLAASRQLITLRERATEVTAELSIAVENHQSLRQRHLDLREARINAMAGELAAALTAGCSCPVCGSDTHPHPAAVSAGATEADEEAARTAVDDAAIAVEALRDADRTLRHQLATTQSAAQSRTAEQWQESLAQAQTDFEAASDSAGRVDSLVAQAAALAATEAELSSRAHQLQQSATSLSSRLESLAERIEAVQGDAVQLLKDFDSHEPHTVLDQLHVEVADLDAAAEGLREAEDAAAAVEAAAAKVLAHAQDAGFRDWPQVQAAELDREEQERLSNWLTQRQRDDATARAVLGDQQLADLGAADAPDLETCQARREQAEQARDAALADEARLANRVARVASLSGDLDAALARLRPALDRAEVATAVSTLLEGRSSDNRLRLRLSAYVLSERLAQVVDAANDRLSKMGQGRFALEQCDESTGRGRRGGLGLRVHDAWTSTVRATGSLSGGETFMVSLALALGLADTVSAESGGTRIETLFVDEGFGSLDSEALEGVLDTLDSLREGGRSVGVVSHVSEMRDRICTQVRVAADASSGSTLQVVLG